MSSETAIRILVVEDSDDLRHGTARLLAGAGYAVTTAANGAEALVSLREHPPRLVLLDRRLPDIDGLEVCRRIKADPATVDILVILASGQLVTEEAQITGLERGADGYITRPIENRELLARLAAFARLARTTQRLAEEIERRRQLEANLEERVQRRTRELTDANQKLEEARRAALNLMQDATLVQRRLASVNEELRLDITERNRVEAALRRSEELFRADFEESPVGRCLVKPEGQFLRVNAAFGRMLGYTASEFQLLTILDVTHPEDRVASRQGVAELLAGHRQHLDLEKRYLTKTGQTVWGSVHASLRRSDDGAPLHFSVVLQDITARRKSEAALQVSEALLRSTQQLSKVGGWEWDVRAQTMQWTAETYLIHDMNSAEYTPGSPEHIAQSAACYAPEDRPRVLEAFRRCATMGEAYDFEVPFTSVTGRALWVRTKAEAVWMGPTVIKVIGNLMDITARKQAEEALHASEARLQGILRTAPTGIGVVVNRVIRDVNQHVLDLTGYSRDELVGVSSRMLYPTEEEFVEVGRAKYQQIKEVGTGTVESRWRRKDGVITDVLISSTPLDPADHTKGTTFTVLDITARRRAEQAIKHSLAEQEVLLKEVHHRVKNNLQVVSGLLELQAARLPDPQVRLAFKESQGRIKSIALVHEKLYQAEGLARLDFKAYVQSLVAQLFHAHLGTGRLVRCDLQMPDVTLSLATAVPCGLLINELVTNALKHAFREDVGACAAGVERAARRPENKLVLTWEDAGAQWRLTMADNGPGLPAGLDWAQASTLGLRLVQMLTQQLQGSVRLEPGAGCRFVIEFPKP